MEPGVLVQRHVEEGHEQGEDVKYKDPKQEGETVKEMEKRSSSAKPSLVPKVNYDKGYCLSIVFVYP